ncbi:hypothetical protein LguiA_018845 [Lonicera macranthoides]
MEKQSSLTIIGILGKSLKTTFRNGKLVLSIMLFVFLSLSFLELGGHLVTKPFLEDLFYKSSKVDPQQFKSLNDFDEGTLKDIKILLVLELGALVLSFATLLFFSIATISSSSAAYTAKTLTLKDMLLWVRARWTAAFITTIYMTLISVAVFCLFSILLGMGSLLTHGLGSYSLKIGTSVLVGVVCYIYLSVSWMMSLVVSVVENECSGLKAINRAGEILKGKRLKACAVMVLFTIIASFVYMSCFVVVGMLGKEGWARMVVRISSIWSLCLVKFFLFVVYTMFYHECNKCEKEEEGEGKPGLYLPLASGDV